MQIHSAERRVSLSVGELACFRLGPGEGYGMGGAWRLALGSAWHASLHEEAQAQTAVAGTPADAVLAGILADKVTAGTHADKTLAGTPADAAQPALPTAENASPLADAAATGEIPFATAASAGETVPAMLRTEAGLAVTLVHKGWRFELTGRVDQESACGNAVLLREIKTTALPLPAAAGELGERYPHYFRQLALYVHGWQVLHSAQRTGADKSMPFTADGELCFVNIHDGYRQTIAMDAAEATRTAETAMERLLPFLEARSQGLVNAGQAKNLRAFAHYREGQQEAVTALRSGFLATPVTVFEAPTGFGKTGVVLEAALEQLRSGLFNRVIYLSGKTTGQHQVMRQLRLMDAFSQWRCFQLRSRREHTQQPLRQRSAQSRSAAATGNAAPPQWEDFGIRPAQLLDNQQADVGTLRQLGARTGLCPYELAKACLPYADVLVGDYNYVFSPRHRRVFFDQPDFNATQTLLIVDEVHNLASRVADLYSVALNAAEAEAVALDLRLAQASFLLVRAWEMWAEFLQGIKPSEDLGEAVAAEAAVLLATLCERMQTDMPDEECLQPFTRDSMAEAFAQWQVLRETALPRLCWSPRHGSLFVSCLDAAAPTAETLRRFGAVVLMSATASPHDILCESLGLVPQQTGFVSGRANWRDNAYEVAIDATVDTRLRLRATCYRQTAETIGRFAAGAYGPLTVFFPSYLYAETVLKYLEALHPELIVKVQPRAIDAGGQLTFVEESLLLAHVLFFVLGSSFSESIDHLGGRVDRAMVVGPALPEVNPVQNARLARLEALGRQEAFRRVYQIPALQKINQALGRLVREPGQSARILLHDQRFAQSSYRELLAPEYRTDEVLTAADALCRWLDK